MADSGAASPGASRCMLSSPASRVEIREVSLDSAAVARAGVLQQQRDLARGRDVHLAADLPHGEDDLLHPLDVGSASASAANSVAAG